MLLLSLKSAPWLRVSVPELSSTLSPRTFIKPVLNGPRIFDDRIVDEVEFTADGQLGSGLIQLRGRRSGWSEVVHRQGLGDRLGVGIDRHRIGRRKAVQLDRYDDDVVAAVGTVPVSR